MRFVCVLALGVLLAGAVPAAAEEPPALAKARALYNSGDHDGAIAAAAVARRQPEAADAAALVLARSHLERYRQRANPADLAAARDAFGAIHAEMLSPRDHVDLLIGLGQSLFLGEIFGAAAELFETGLGRGSLLEGKERVQLLDWWATALDRESQSRPPERRAAIFERVLARMQDELRQDPANPVANYWLAVAARGVGDLDRAWAAAVAAWVRSSLAPASAAGVRADLDRLVTQALIPERVRRLSSTEQADATVRFDEEWALVKNQWK